MTLEAYARLVAECRDAQRSWSTYHSSDELRRAKALEKRLDAATRKILDGTPDLPGMEDT